MRLFFYFPIILFALTQLANGEDREKSDKDPLTGSWIAISGQQNGKPISKNAFSEHHQTAPLSFADGSLTISYSISYTFDNPATKENPKWNTLEASDWPLAYHIELEKEPKEITVYENKNDKAHTVSKGIFKIEKNTLTICWGTMNFRPKNFITTEDDDCMVVVYERMNAESNHDKSQASWFGESSNPSCTKTISNDKLFTEADMNRQKNVRSQNNDAPKNESKKCVTTRLCRKRVLVWWRGLSKP